jgi:hypothetical protein
MRQRAECPDDSFRHATVVVRRENQRDNDIDRYELNRSIQASRRGGRKKARARSSPCKTAYPSAFSQARPLSRITRPYGRTRTDLTPRFSSLESGSRWLY